MGKNFSVLMPVYKKDNPKYLKEALESLLLQTVMPTEIVIVIDGKIDEKLNKVISKCKEQNEEIINVYYFATNRGLGLVLKDGVNLCKNEIIARMDSDDICKNDRFEKQLKLIDDYDVIGSYIEEIDASGLSTHKIRVTPQTKNIKKFIKRRNPLNHMTIMFKKEAVLNVGNYEDMPYFEDYYLWFKIFVKGYKIYNIQEVLVYARIDNFINKRSGFEYLKREFKFQNKLLAEKYINIIDYIINLIFRCLCRILPQKNIKQIYNNLLRKNIH